MLEIGASAVKGFLMSPASLRYVPRKRTLEILAMRALALPREMTRGGLRVDAATMRRLFAILFLLLCAADAVPLEGDHGPALFGWSSTDSVFDNGVDALATGDCTPSLVGPDSSTACAEMQPAAAGFAVSLAEASRAPPLA